MTPTLSPDAFQPSTTAVSDVASCFSPVGTVGACVSGQAEVETVVSARGDRFPARSNATTPTATLSPQSRYLAV